MDFCEVVDNLQNIFEGAFLPSDDDEHGDDYIVIDVKTSTGRTSICLRKDILQMPLFLKAKENQMNGSDLDGSRLKRKLDKYNCQICDFVARKKVKIINHMSNVHNETIVSIVDKSTRTEMI